MKDLAQKGEDSGPQLEGKVLGEQSLVDETRQIIDGQRRLKCLNGQQTGDGMRQQVVDSRHGCRDTEMRGYI